MTQQLIVARHGESECNVRAVVNGDPRSALQLTAEGVRQARVLRDALRDHHIDVAIATEFGRTQETARTVVSDRAVELVIVPELNDPPAGRFEDRPLTELLAWLDETPWDAPVPEGGESQLDSVRRFIRGWQVVLDRPEGAVLVVAHAFAISFALTVASGQGPALRRKYEIPVELAHAQHVDVGALSEGLERARAELAALV